MVVGREMWHFMVRHVVTSSYKALLDEKWTILRPSPGAEWPTTDHPSVCIANGQLSVMVDNVGWKTRGAELIMPLSPEHLLYCRIGVRSLARGSEIGRAHV